MAVGFGDGLRPLPIVPRGLTAESLAAPHDEQAQILPTDVPIRMIMDRSGRDFASSVDLRALL